MTADQTSRGDVALGLAGAALLHAAAVFLLFVNADAPQPVMNVMQTRVRMTAAPLGEPAVGVVQAPPAAAETPAPRAAERIPDPAKTTPTLTKKQPPKTVPKQATVTPNAAKSVKNAPTAGSEVGGKGSDLANVDLGGVDFPFPAYQRNIINRIAEHFRTTEQGRVAEVMFTIRRDGTVDVDQMQLVTRSGSYPFDNAAMGAIEAVSNKRMFGPLPEGFQSDALTIVFKFEPLIKPPQ